MIISKTPLRMSFVGGSSDIMSFYKESPGAVVSTTIDKYIYVTVNKKFDNDIRLSYSKTENIKTVDEIEHRLIKTVLKELKINGGIEITSIADAPSKGTGLGSSSSFTVGLLNALYAYKNSFSSPEKLANEACKIEIERLKDPIGKQDQYAAAYGGLNFIEFSPDETVTVNPIIFSKEKKAELESNTLVLYTGLTRSASKILNDQSSTAKKEENNKTIKKMVKLAHQLKAELEKNNLDSFGEILHENWIRKKELSDNVSTPEIDNWYERGRKNGALGGKLLGAGGGGFLMFYAPREKHSKIISTIPELKPISFKFSNESSRIIFAH